MRNHQHPNVSTKKKKKLIVSLSLDEFESR